MRPHLTLAVSITIATLIVAAHAAPFVLFPKAGQLTSPDGRLAVRNRERDASDKEFVGTAHSLWLVEAASGRSRKLCDYLGVAAVAWSNNDFVVVTEYVARKTSRAWVFPIAAHDEAVMFDKSTLIRMVPAELRDTLRENDHVFVEASSVQEKALHLRVWGYGLHDACGFRWSCAYDMREGTLSCSNDQNKIQPKQGTTVERTLQ
jgi:hypothetical protein